VNEAVEDFRRLAAEYCALVEQPPRIVELQEALLDLLPRLYLAGSALPLVEPETEDLLPDRPTSSERFAVMEGLQEVLGQGSSSVADDLVDIWKDLNQGSSLSNRAHPKPTSSFPGAMTSPPTGAATR
jgi:hypothetical protein